jgi:transposase-like protein
MRQRVIAKVQPEIETLKVEGCKYCGSLDVVKIGVRHNTHRDVQRCLCKKCGHKFALDDGFEKIKATPKAITVALDLYFKGVSQRKIVDHLKQSEGVVVTQPAILKWIRKYIELMSGYVEQFQPQVSGFWHSDEMTLNVRKTQPTAKGNYDWLWNLMDHETRFLLASQVTKHREIEDAQKVFKKAKETTDGQMPDFVVTDKLHSYNDAFKKEFFTLRNPRTKHIKLKSIREGTNNNIVERLNGTVRERVKVIRGLDNDESAQKTVDGYRLYYNFIRPHQSLNGQTPAQKAGINLGNEQNKWQEIIKKAHQTPKVIKGEKPIENPDK